MKKVIFLSIGIIFLALVASLLFIFDFDGEGIRVREEARPFIRKYVPKFEMYVYSEATKHNPEGDMLPDNIDDEIKEKLRDELWR